MHKCIASNWLIWTCQFVRTKPGCSSIAHSRITLTSPTYTAVMPCFVQRIASAWLLRFCSAHPPKEPHLPSTQSCKKVEQAATMGMVCAVWLECWFCKSVHGPRLLQLTLRNPHFPAAAHRVIQGVVRLSVQHMSADKHQVRWDYGEA